jgi:hypothetical protein
MPVTTTSGLKQPLDPRWRLSVVECLRLYPVEDAIRAMEARRAELVRACPPGMLPLGVAAARLGVGAAQLAGFLATRPKLRKRCRTVDSRVYVPERLLAGVCTAVKNFRLGNVPRLRQRRRG